MSQIFESHLSVISALRFWPVVLGRRRIYSSKRFRFVRKFEPYFLRFQTTLSSFILGRKIKHQGHNDHDPSNIRPVMSKDHREARHALVNSGFRGIPVVRLIDDRTFGCKVQLPFQRTTYFEREHEAFSVAWTISSVRQTVEQQTQPQQSLFRRMFATKFR